MAKKYISWRRVSTFKQNRSGLGLEAQKEIIRYFVERDGGELIADYSECYTGKELSGCKELRKAMQHAKNIGAVLVIAKSDRFRNCQEALGILDEMGEGYLEFCDLPHSDRFTLTLFWALAEREALITSIRTKQALAVKKEKGCRLGAASIKYMDSYNAKSDAVKSIESKKRGESKRLSHQRSKNVQAFLRVIRNVFPSATGDEEPSKWNWRLINTKNGAKERILHMMQDYRCLDNELFSDWDFTIGERKLSMKLCSYMQNVKKSYLWV